MNLIENGKENDTNLEEDNDWFEDEEELRFIMKNNHTEEDYEKELKRIMEMRGDKKEEDFYNRMKETTSKDRDYELLENVDIKTFDILWSYSDFYLSRRFEEIKQKSKYINSRRDLMKMRIDQPPFIEVLPYGMVEILNGRNRFANMRDLKFKKIPLMMKREHISPLLKMIKKIQNEKEE
jgi:hypothetical protein